MGSPPRIVFAAAFSKKFSSAMPRFQRPSTCSARSCFGSIASARSTSLLISFDSRIFVLAALEQRQASQRDRQLEVPLGLRRDRARPRCGRRRRPLRTRPRPSASFSSYSARAPRSVSERARRHCRSYEVESTASPARQAKSAPSKSNPAYCSDRPSPPRRRTWPAGSRAGRRHGRARACRRDAATAHRANANAMARAAVAATAAGAVGGVRVTGSLRASNLIPRAGGVKRSFAPGCAGAGRHAAAGSSRRGARAPRRTCESACAGACRFVHRLALAQLEAGGTPRMHAGA